MGSVGTNPIFNEVEVGQANQIGNNLVEYPYEFEC